MGTKRQLRKLREMQEELEATNETIARKLGELEAKNRNLEESHQNVITERDEALVRASKLEGHANEIETKLARQKKNSKEAIDEANKANKSKIDELQASLKGWRELVQEITGERQLAKP